MSRLPIPLPIPLQRFVTPVEDGHPFHFPSTIPTQDIKTNNNNLTNNKTNPASNPTVDLNKKRADSELQKHGSNQEHLNFTNQTSQQQQTPNDSITRSLQLSTNSDNLNSNPSTLASLVEGLNWQDSKAPLNRQDSAHQKINKILSDHKAGSFEKGSMHEALNESLEHHVNCAALQWKKNLRGSIICCVKQRLKKRFPEFDGDALFEVCVKFVKTRKRLPNYLQGIGYSVMEQKYISEIIFEEAEKLK